MPIRPENKDRYPDNWMEIRGQILERAGNRCEFCGVDNYAIGYWIKEGDTEIFFHEDCYHTEAEAKIKIILTIAHLDHTPENCDPENLKALCQRCHNRYDAPMRAAGIRQRKFEKKATGDLFNE